MSEELKYKPLPKYANREAVSTVLESGTFEEKMLLSLSVGDSFPDWKFAQGVCLKLAESDNEAIRANACLGLAYIARTHGKLEKHLVKPVLLRELRGQTEFKWRIQDSIEDINGYLNWKLATKHQK